MAASRAFTKWEQNYTAIRPFWMITYILMSWFKTFDSKQKTEKEQKNKKLVFKKIVEIIENAYLHKPVLNKIMTTQE